MKSGLLAISLIHCCMITCTRSEENDSEFCQIHKSNFDGNRILTFDKECIFGYLDKLYEPAEYIYESRRVFSTGVSAADPRDIASVYHF